MTDKTLSVMTVDEFQKHMASELTALEANPDDDRQMSLRKSLDAFNAIDKKDEHARIPVELHKSDPDGAVKELAAKFDALEKKLEAFMGKGKDEDDDSKLTDEEKAKKAEEAKKAADEAEAKKVADAEAAKKEEDEKKAKEEAAAKAKEPVDWDSDMGHAVLTPAETIAKKKE